ncbi:MAG TPA: ABC transporter substrate-binding protein [Rhodothermales bacterium]|nr:ABC transporter substrate-binding protein [Rhodothermales bacterium]
MRKFTLFQTCILLFLMLSFGCSGRQGTSGDVVTLTFWHSFVATTQPALKELIRRFEAEHPNIRVDAQYIPTGDALIQKLVSSVRSHTAPDISWVHADFLGPLVQARAIYPMDTFIKGENGLTDAQLADLFPGFLEAAKWQDTLYAMPMEGTLLALFYNRDMFREAGLDPSRPPRTWDELRSFTQKLTVMRPGGTDIRRVGFYVPAYPASGPLDLWMVLQWLPYLWQAGGVAIDTNQTRVLYNSPAGVQALSLWNDLYRATGSTMTSMSHDVAFVSKYAAMIMDGPWDLPRFRKMENLDWAVAPLPEGPAGRATYLAGEHLAIFRQSEHPDAAWTFIKWMIRPETQAFFSEQSGYLPVTRSTLSLPEYQQYLEHDPALRAFVEQIPMGRPRRHIDYFHVEINRHIAEAIEKTLVGDMDPQAALNESAAKSNQLLRSTRH